MRHLFEFRTNFFFIPFASAAGGLRNCNAAPLASFNTPDVAVQLLYSAFFIESSPWQTEPNEASYAITGVFKGILRRESFIGNV